MMNIIDYLEGIYGKMAVQRREKLKYLGMELNYSTKGEAIITMNSYIKETLEDFPKEDWVPASSPTSDHLFKMNAKKL